jgi:soluble lytic murein transglycosylase-like protein
MRRALLPAAIVLVVAALAGCRSSTGGTPRVSAGPEPTVGRRSAPSFDGTVAERCAALEPLMREAAVRRGIDVGLIAGIVRVESTFRPHVESRAGAIGLMQVMPSNASRLGCGDLREPRANLECGLEVLARFLAYYDHDVVLALSGYNSGHRRPNTARREQTTPANLAYVEKVLAARTTYLRRGCGQ